MRSALLICGIFAAISGAQTTLTPTPASLSFSYQAGAALPSAQTVSVRITSGTPSYSVSISTPSSAQAPLWITATPETGKMPASLTVRVNPTGMAVGVYYANIQLSLVGATGSIAIPVTLTVMQPLPTLNISRLTVPATAPPNSITETVALTTTAGPISFTASAAGAPWLTVSPLSGVVLPGAPKTLTFTIDASSLAPQTAPYTGKVTVVASGVAAANRSQNITVNLTVNSTPPTITDPLWPSSAQVGSAATTVTIRGTGFYKDTTVKVTPTGSTTSVKITPTLLSASTLLAVIPANLLATAQVLAVQASNPGGDSASKNFTVSATPVVQAVVNLASYVPGPVSPGQLVTLFGTGIGPVATAAMTDGDANGYADTTINGVSVTIDGVAAPLLYVSQHQISVQVPYAAKIGTARDVKVTNGTVTAVGLVDIAAAAPAIFTLDGSGTGQAAALTYSGGAYTLNSTTSPAKPGDRVIIYLTGEGDYATDINPRTGYLVPSAMALLPSMNPVPAVTIGGVDATVEYAGPFVGSILGILQINAVVPPKVTTGNLPVVVTINKVASQSGVTLAIHQ